MKRWLPFVLAAWWCGFQKVDAQYVTIPDPNFVSWLQYHYPGCMNGNQLDTTCTAITTATSATINNVSNVNGIRYFDNLLNLTIDPGGSNPLVPQLPPGLKSLFVSTTAYPSTLYFTSFPVALSDLSIDAWNNLGLLPPLPNSMHQLIIRCENIAALPSLPSAVDTLILVCNNMTDFPPIPSNVQLLTCGGTNLQYIPDLPATLQELDVNYSDIIGLGGVLNTNNIALTQLPTLNDMLNTLHCEYAHLTSLPDLPSGLTFLDVGHNDLTDLPYLNNVQALFCGYNQITSLPGSPLHSLDCSNNLLTYLPPLSWSLQYLVCEHNQLSTLPSLPNTINWLNCGNNNLSTIPAFHGQFLFCDSNQLSSITSLPTVMNLLDCRGNSGLMCLPPVKKINGWWIDTVNISQTGITCLPNYIQHPGYIPQIDTLPLCPIVNPNNCPTSWNITGTVFNDANANCQKDNGEAGLQNIKLNLLHTDGTLQEQVFCNGAGRFSFQSSLDTFHVSIDTFGLPFNILCPVNNSHSSIVTTLNPTDTTAKFALQCKPGYDLAATHLTGSVFRTGHLQTVVIHAGDLAQHFGVACNTVGLAGTVSATFNGQVTFSNASTGGLENGNTVTWNINDFSAVNQMEFWMVLHTDTNAVIGQDVCITATVSASGGTDNDTSNNHITQCFQVVSGYDPNYKEVSPRATTPGDWLIYTVHFQNVGNASAENILIKDTLSTQLAWSTLQLLETSHPCIVQVKPGGVLHFNFPNINLPDSTTDEPNSHGWIQYRIKSNPDIQPGTTIHNTASIYFDFNTPVVTNDAVVNYCMPQQTNQSFSICQGDSVQVGSNWYYQDGTYTNLFPSASGCDSVVTTTLTVTSVNTFVSTVDNVLSATGDGMFQWYDCNANAVISGATNATFSPTQNGSYAVQVTDTNGCSAMSNCYDVTGVGVASIHQGVFKLYPNPSNGAVILSHPSGLSNAVIVLTDLAGRVLYVAPLSQSVETTLQPESLAAGLYALRVMQEGKTLANEKLTLLR